MPKKAITIKYEIFDSCTGDRIRGDLLSAKEIVYRLKKEGIVTTAKRVLQWKKDNTKKEFESKVAPESVFIIVNNREE